MGNDIKRKLHVTSWMACRDFCRKTANCKVWTLVRNSRRECFAKTSASGRRSMSNAVSGSISCGETNNGSVLSLPYLFLSGTSYSIILIFGSS